MKNLLIACALLIVFSAVATGRISAPSPDDKATARAAASSGAKTARRDSDVLELHRDSSGQFNTVAQVNGEDVSFLVDTGADTIALTVGDAEQLGLDVDTSAFMPIGRTASGVGYGQPVRLDRVEIAGEQFHDVDAVVMDGLETNLLGQSVLRRLGRVELRGDRMVIHPAG
jgi:aspartyl protease family protein